MKDRAPIIDTIDMRNFKNDLKKTVVKRSRVHFVTLEEEEAMKRAAEGIEEGADNTATGEDVPNSNIPEGVEIVDPTLDVSGIDPDVLAQADEIFRRLQREAEEDDLAKKREWEEKISAANDTANEKDPNYNATTGSYSGTYGQGEISDEAKAQAEAILNMRKDELQSIIKENSGDE